GGAGGGGEALGVGRIEAVCGGSRVVGTRRGALPEVITPEVGALGDTIDELVEASRTIASRKPEACRAHAERYFSQQKMTETYLEVYRQFCATGKVPAGTPTPWSQTS